MIGSNIFSIVDEINKLCNKFIVNWALAQVDKECHTLMVHVYNNSPNKLKCFLLL